MWFMLNTTFDEGKHLGHLDTLQSTYSVSYTLTGLSKRSSDTINSIAKTQTSFTTKLDLKSNYTWDSSSTISATGGTVTSATLSGTILTVVVGSVTGSVAIVAKATYTGGGSEGDDDITDPTPDGTYTITYKYMSGSTEIKTATTETVTAGTTKTFSTSGAPTISGYTISSVSPSGAQTINANTTVTYTYTANEASGNETDISNLFITAGLTPGAIYAQPTHASFGGTHSSQTAYYANGANTAYVNVQDYAGKTLKITLPYAKQPSHVSYGIAFYTATGKSNAIAEVTGTTLTYTDGSVGYEVREIVIPATAKLARTTWLTPEDETTANAVFSAKIVN